MAAVDYPRYLEKFENDGGTVSQVFPVKQYEWESSQGLRAPSAAIAGAHYELDLLGTGLGLKSSARERLRFLIPNITVATIETDFDTLKEKIYKIGRGKLYVINAAGDTRRWAYARPLMLPSSLVRVGQPRVLTVSALEFRRDSDWFGAAQSINQTVSASPTTWTVTNPGNAPVYNAIMRLRANGAAGFANPMIENLTNGYYWSSSRGSISANSELKVDAGKATVEWSDNDGSSYADDFALFTRGTLQVQFMKLDVGANSIRYSGSGTPSLDVLFTFDAPWH